MSSGLPRILTLLRKEKGISQKQAAKDLEVSQALLSHYEKGIRNCGLDFVIKCADYYDVSCDYLLGRSPERQGSTLTIEDIPESDAGGKENIGIGSVLTQLNKKLIANSQNILFDMLTHIGNKDLTNEVSAYLTLAVYKMFRVIYSSNPKNEQAMFQIPEIVYPQYADSAMQIADANARSIAKGVPVGKLQKIKSAEELEITTEKLAEDYPLFSSSLLNMIQNAESKIEHKK